MVMDPYLLFEFVDLNGNKQPKVFKNPVKVIVAEEKEEVEAAFQQAEHALEEGFYVAGCVSYEAAPAFDPAFVVHKNPSWPLVWFGVFPEPVTDPKFIKQTSFHVTEWEMTGDFDQYQEGIESIKRAIQHGDTYQVNYTTRLQSGFSGSGYSFYKQLAANQQSSYSAYLNLGDRSLLSASPELFFRTDGETITTKPMKGTARRGRWVAEDQEQRDLLHRSEKERSENLMIVDLLRNDVGRIAVPGSVSVPHLFEVESYPTVHQMTSTVTGKLKKGTGMLDIFRALFPCGSITGAPKIRTMEYIADLEDNPRDIYCGAIGYMTPDNGAIFNVPIRTVMVDHQSGTAVYGTGGGITWDSTSKGEYEELQTKAQLLTEKRPEFQLLETMKLEDGLIPLLEYHLNRMSQSAVYFDYKFDREHLEYKLMQIADQYQTGSYKVRLLTNANGEEQLEATRITESPGQVSCKLADGAVNEQDPFLFHKTTHRDIYNQHKDDHFFSVLLWNTKGELTEFTIANLVVRQDGRYYTPPVSSGLLAGTFRQQLLEEEIITEKVLYKDELDMYDEIWMINGVRGWIQVHLTIK